MRLSVVICTRNRQAALARLLQSIAGCEKAFGDGDWEVLIVTNSETADAAAVDRWRCPTLPLRVVNEPHPGLSHARNRGAACGHGDWLLWTDDDVTVSPRWLTEYRHAIEQFPDARVLGGPIHPRLEGRPPAWLVNGQEHVRSAFASREPDDVDDTFEAGGSLPYGANFAIRRADALRYPFDPGLGRHPERPTRGWEEVLVIRRILASGHGRWLRDAAVTHHIDASRQTATFIRAYYFDTGFVASMQRAHSVRRRHAVARLGRALREAIRNERDLARFGTGATRAERAAALRAAAQSWGDAKAWLTTLVSARTVSVWRARGVE